MCTVTFIPGKDSLFFTSNRDEKNGRTDALPPAIHTFNSGRVLYPKDGDAGGTWIAAHENGNVVVFLNGGIKPHTPSPPYKKSRGLILLDLIDHQTPYNCFNAINLNNIEPFTAILFDNHHLFECRWDGLKKHHKELDTKSPYIWSSVTLYDNKMIGKRNEWFEEWLGSHSDPSRKNIMEFHQFPGDGDPTNGVRMNRGKIFTVSITSLELTNSALLMDYVDLKNNVSSSEKMLFETSIAGT